jgi:hypothetical protein
VVTFPGNLPNEPNGHTFLRTTGGTEHVYYATPYPLLRARAVAESLAHPEQFEAFTCLAEGSGLDEPRIDRGPDGVARYRWRAGTPAIEPPAQARLLKAGLLKPEEALLALRDVETGKAVTGHGGSVAWNEHRRRWVMIAVEAGGSSSYLGEVWYAEADTPQGPWVHARKVATHDRYSFYNPKHHPYFDKEGGRVLFFEGTYTHTFSGNDDPTPRYDYNQVMYRLDLADPRLNLPVAVYHRGDGYATGPGNSHPDRERAAFFALERAGVGTIPIVAKGGALVANPTGGGDERPIFHALPADATEPPPATVPLHEFVGPTDRPRVYSTDASWSAEGYRRLERPLCRVWPNPLRLELPWD